MRTLEQGCLLSCKNSVINRHYHLDNSCYYQVLEHEISASAAITSPEVYALLPSKCFPSISLFNIRT